MNKEEFNQLGMEIDFIPYGNNPEHTITGIVFTEEEYNMLREELFKR